jgi:exodeoxyribonuclease-3
VERSRHPRSRASRRHADRSPRAGGLRRPRKLAWFDSLQSYLESAHDAHSPIVVGGDFNLCPAPIDSWNEEALAGHIFHTAEERSRFARLLAWGLFDLYRERLPEKQMFSWWDYRGGAFHRNHGLRIDFLLGSRPVLERLVDVEIDRDYRKKKEGWTASDHAPVIAELA